MEEPPKGPGIFWTALGIVFAALIAVVGAVALYRTLDSTLAQHTEDLLDEVEGTIANSVSSRQARYDVIGGGIGAYVLASEEITAEEWRQFSHQLIVATNAVSGFTGLLYAPRTEGNRYSPLLSSDPDADAEIRGANLAEDPRFAPAIEKATRLRGYTLSDPFIGADGAEFTLGFVPIFTDASVSEPIGMAMVRQASGRGQRAIVDMFDTNEYVPGVRLAAELIEPGKSLSFQNAAFEQIEKSGIGLSHRTDFSFGGRAYRADIIAPHGLGVPDRDRLLAYIISSSAGAAIFVILIALIVILANRRALARQVKEVSRAQSLTLDALEDVKKAKENAEQQRQYVQTILSSVGEGIIATDDKGVVTSVNPAAERITGVSAAELIGRHPSEKIVLLAEGKPIPDEARPTNRMRADPAHERVRDNSLDIKRADGSTVPISTEVMPQLKDGKLTGAIVQFRDITLEREVDKAKSEFASLASHQMKAPLGTIKWYVELLSDPAQGQLNDEQKKLLQVIADADKRMLKLINSMLSVTRMESGTFSAVPEPVILPSVVHAYVLDNAPAAASRNMKVTEDYAKDLSSVSMDPQLLGAVIQNLLSNAIRYTKPGGSITVRVFKDGDRVKISVADTGIGIPPEAMLTLWDKGYRTKEAETMDSTGTGLGLYLLKNIIDATGGTITVESVVGKGSTFTVAYPLTGMKAHAGTKTIEVPGAEEVARP